jgi:hypothetical protein
MNKEQKSKTNNKCSKKLDSSVSRSSQCYVLWNTVLGLHGLQKKSFFFLFLSDLYLLKNNLIALIFKDIQICITWIKLVYVINTYSDTGQLKVVMECANAFWIKHVCTVHNKQPGTGMVLVCLSELIVDETVTKACDLVVKKKCVVLLKNMPSLNVSGTCTGSFVMEKQGCAMQWNP